MNAKEVSAFSIFRAALAAPTAVSAITDSVLPFACCALGYCATNDGQYRNVGDLSRHVFFKRSKFAERLGRLAVLVRELDKLQHMGSPWPGPFEAPHI